MRKIYILLLLLAGLTIFNAALFAYDLLNREAFKITSELAAPLIVGLAAAAFGIRTFRKMRTLSAEGGGARLGRSVPFNLSWGVFVAVFAVLGLVVLFLSSLSSFEASEGPVVGVYVFYVSLLIYGFFRYRRIKARCKADGKISMDAHGLISDLFGGAVGWFWLAATVAVIIVVVLAVSL